jgi:hypothetical protein
MNAEPDSRRNPAMTVKSRVRSFAIAGVEARSSEGDAPK